MNAFLEYLVKYVQLLRISDLIDILIVSVIVYYLINLIRETCEGYYIFVYSILFKSVAET